MGTVSEALHKARADLEFKLKLQKEERTTAEDNINRIKAERWRLQADFNDKSKWYKIWHWKIWSDTLRNLEKSISDLFTEEENEKARKNNCAELISRLSAQIESKLTASALAEVEEVAIDELEKQ